ncbi:MAG TPA: glycosyltransferase family 2 protein, partial [Gammaproteobacteria bacterium]
MNVTKANISVVMPAYNLAAYIEASVNSALRQTWRDFELIVVDDGSSDETAAIVERLAADDSRIRLLRSDGNLGGAGARNLGLARARGRYVAFLDGDDLWHPGKLERQLDVLQDTGAEICYTAIQKVDAGGRPFGRVQAVPASVDYAGLLGNPLIGCSTVLLDYEALGRPLMPEIRKRQDFAFWLMLLRNGARAVGVNEPLTCYRVRPGSLSANKMSAAWHVWR